MFLAPCQQATHARERCADARMHARYGHVVPASSVGRDRAGRSRGIRPSCGCRTARSRVRHGSPEVLAQAASGCRSALHAPLRLPRSGKAVAAVKSEVDASSPQKERTPSHAAFRIVAEILYPTRSYARPLLAQRWTEHLHASRRPQPTDPWRRGMSRRSCGCRLHDNSAISYRENRGLVRAEVEEEIQIRRTRRARDHVGFGRLHCQGSTRAERARTGDFARPSGLVATMLA